MNSRIALAFADQLRDAHPTDHLTITQLLKVYDDILHARDWLMTNRAHLRQVNFKALSNSIAIYHHPLIDALLRAIRRSGDSTKEFSALYIVFVALQQQLLLHPFPSIKPE